jgi:hypothetical protein
MNPDIKTFAFPLNNLISNPIGNPIVNEGASVMQSERIFQQADGRWYFRIRGNTTMGPYSNHREASESMNRYVASCRRQAEMGFTWPRWLHVRHWTRKVETHAATTPKPRQALTRS